MKIQIKNTDYTIYYWVGKINVEEGCLTSKNNINKVSSKMIVILDVLVIIFQTQTQKNCLLFLEEKNSYLKE